MEELQGPHASTRRSTAQFSSLFVSSLCLPSGLKRAGRKKKEHVAAGELHRLVVKDGGIQSRHGPRSGCGVREWDSCVCGCGVNGERSLRRSLYYTYQQETKLSCRNVICCLQMFSPFTTMSANWNAWGQVWLDFHTLCIL